MIEQVKASDYVILCNRLMEGEINEEKEHCIKEACNIINCSYYPREIEEMVNEDIIPDLNKLVKEYLG